MKHSNISIFIPHLGCPNQCSFCNQQTITGQQDTPTVKQVEEMLQRAILLLKRPPEETEIAFFGGSFTAIDYNYMCELLELAQSCVRQYHLKGIRISTRPDYIDKEVLSCLKRYGVTSIELGAQSMDNRVLSANHRGHTKEQVIAACEQIRSDGFELGLQMMVGLYQDTPEISLQTAREILRLQPDTVRIYPTVVLENTCLAKWYQQGIYHPMSLETAVEICAQMLWMFYQAGISVIKCGLHASEDITSQMVAGIYHPAFRELCESYLYLMLAKKQLSMLSVKGPVTLFVNPTAISKMIGQKRSNLKALEAMLNYPITVREKSSLSLYEISIS